MALPSDVLSTDTFGTWRTKTNQIKDNVLDKTNNLSDLPNVATARTNLQIPQVKHDATVDPTVNNDTSEGYSVGSHWTNITDDKTFFCLDNTDGAAVWEQVGGASLIGTTLAATPFTTALGGDAPAEVTGVYNTLLGYSVGTNVTTGTYNVGIGADALEGDPTSKLTGDDNVGIGYRTGYELTTGSENVFIGGDSVTDNNSAGYYCTSGVGNIGVGSASMRGNNTSKLTGNYNVGVGVGTGFSLTTGFDNVLLGLNAGNTLTTGDSNVFIGSDAGKSATTCGDTVAIGHEALSLGATAYTSSNTTAVGYRAGSELEGALAYSNTLIGSQAGAQSTTGKDNVFVGHLAGLGNGATCTGSYNVAVGTSSLLNFTTGNNNTLIGYHAGDSISSGSYNTSLGNYSGENITTGTYNTTLGHGADTTLNKVMHYTTALGANAYAFRSGELCISNDTTEGVSFSGHIGYYAQLATTTPTEILARGAYRLTIKESSVLTFKAIVTAIDWITGNCAAYELSGAIKRDAANNTAILGSILKTVIAEDTASFDCDITADDTNESLKITVTSASTNITRWTARVDYTEVNF